MRTRKVIALSLISAGAAFLFSGCPSQAPSPCVIGHAGGSGAGNGTGFPYLVQYYLNNDAGAPSAGCTNAAGVAAYGYWPGGDFVGGLFVESYGPVTGSLKLVGMVPEEFGWTNPYTGDYIQGSPNSATPITNNPVVLSNFTTDTQASDGTCIVAEQLDGGARAAAVQQFQPVNADGTLQVLQTVTYSIPRAVVYTAPAAGEGTQIQFAVQITRDDGTNNPCVRNYTGIGLWPTVLCNVTNDCNPNPQTSEGRPIGSGILAGIPYTCNTTIAANDPVTVPANIPLVPNVACTINGAGVDDCSSGACSNTTSAFITPNVACALSTTSVDPCLNPDGGTPQDEVCLAVLTDGGVGGPAGPGDTGICGKTTGVCAVPYMDGYGCVGPATFINTGGGCGGPTVNNNAISGDGTNGDPIGLCFYPNPSPSTFPYLQ